MNIFLIYKYICLHQLPLNFLCSKGVSLILAYLQTFLSFCVFDDFFRLKKKWVFGYSLSTPKPRYAMDQRPLVEGRIANFGIFLDFSSFRVLDDFFHFSKKLGFGVFLVHPPMASVLLSASVERCFVSRERDFLIKSFKIYEYTELRVRCLYYQVLAFFISYPPFLCSARPTQHKIKSYPPNLIGFRVKTT